MAQEHWACFREMSTSTQRPAVNVFTVTQIKLYEAQLEEEYEIGGVFEEGT